MNIALKPTAFAAALLAAASASHAQVLDPGKIDLTWYGVADLAVVSADSGFGRKLRIDGGGGMSASRLGLRASRTFTGGIRAFAILEAGLFFDTGGANTGTPAPGTNVTSPTSGGQNGTGPRLFARQALAGIDSSLGTIAMGRQYSLSYSATGAGSAWGPGFYANSANLVAYTGSMPTRFDNALLYTSPVIAGFTVQAMVSTGAENNINAPVTTAGSTITDKSGQGLDVGVRYANGPLKVGVTSWDVNNNAYAVGETALAKKRGSTIVGTYDFGPVLLAATYVQARITGGNYENVTKVLSKSDGWGLSARIPFGEGKRHNVLVSYASLNDKSLLNRDAKLYGAAYWYQLEAATNVYVSYGTMKNNANAFYALGDAGNLVGNVSAPGVKPTGVAVGINYTF